MKLPLYSKLLGKREGGRGTEMEERGAREMEIKLIVSAGCRRA